MSQSQFNHVFLSQRVILLRTLQRMVNNPSTAEDLLQETYLRVTRALSEHPIDHLEPFVYQTARNLALDHLRARKIQARTLLDDVPSDVVEGIAAELEVSLSTVQKELKLIMAICIGVAERLDRP